MSHLQSPDMVAFTIGRVALSLVQDHETISGDAIEVALHRIAKGHITDRISKEMAQGALAVIAAAA
ncbi:hypothetical protein [Paracoccus sp. TOH]|uniref:Uncharacterized protein n=1 Tax=Paracoccus simplex TaxID=2086346 RepID=A0ABV7S076_9RHOB|nr:hypothetical protein [Paracoccus sp. TOH]WJS87389.1 hypothetical protein NBE95_22225 [Paracoccus sp. TOH]